jgi:hypothetical protein
MMEWRREKEQPTPGRENWIDATQYTFMTRRSQERVLRYKY